MGLGTRKNEGPFHGRQETCWPQLPSPVGPPGMVSAVSYHTGSVPNACLCESLSLRGGGGRNLPVKVAELDRMFQKAFARLLMAVWYSTDTSLTQPRRLTTRTTQYITGNDLKPLSLPSAGRVCHHAWPWRSLFRGRYLTPGNLAHNDCSGKT